MSDFRYDPIAMLQTLNRHGVEFLVIGGFAAKLHGSSLITRDLDICYARDRANLGRLADALRELGATLRGAPEGLPFRLDARTLEKGDAFTFATQLGALDILGTPSGSGGYTELAKEATEVDLDDVRIRVVSLDALLAMKRAAGRGKDLVAIEILEALRDEIEHGGGAT